MITGKLVWSNCLLFLSSTLWLFSWIGKGWFLKVSTAIIITMITWGSDLLSDHGQVLLPLRQRLWIRWAPAEGVEHVEEGDGDVDEDDQRVERVWDQLMGTLLISRWRATTCLLLIFKIQMVLVKTTDNQSDNENSLRSSSLCTISVCRLSLDRNGDAEAGTRRSWS